MKKEDYDGFYFLPPNILYKENSITANDDESGEGAGGGEETSLNLAYFKFKPETNIGAPIESTAIGDKFHVAFFRKDEAGDPVFDDEFEAIFADPSVYIKNLIGMNIYGCFLRKTENSTAWWHEYLTEVRRTCTITNTI